ncbi:hypothetical protein [Agromyces sp. LHK192]|uniref:hypothetical protein n=1 Tax=Agromyces sp. LHK192 TaxID=2498704 RepID=UPI000FDA6C3B|nr:hypothetical protein [Agromyces sp. LHK192]
MTLINRRVRIASIDAVVLFVERLPDSTVLYIRAANEADARKLFESRPTLTNHSGELVSHIASHAGGTGLESLVTYVFDGTDSPTLCLHAAGREVFRTHEAE